PYTRAGLRDVLRDRDALGGGRGRAIGVQLRDDPGLGVGHEAAAFVRVLLLDHLVLGRQGIDPAVVPTQGRDPGAKLRDHRLEARGMHPSVRLDDTELFCLGGIAGCADLDPRPSWGNAIGKGERAPKDPGGEGTTGPYAEKERDSRSAHTGKTAVGAVDSDCNIEQYRAASSSDSSTKPVSSR